MTDEAPEIAAQRARLEQNASTALSNLSAAQQTCDQAFADLVDFESKHLREEQCPDY